MEIAFAVTLLGQCIVLFSWCGALQKLGEVCKKSFPGRWDDILLYLSPACPFSALLLSKVSHTQTLYCSSHLFTITLSLESQILSRCLSPSIFFLETSPCPSVALIPIPLSPACWEVPYKIKP